MSSVNSRAGRRRLVSGSILVSSLLCTTALVGTAEAGQDCFAADVNDDSVIDVQDMVLVINGWGPGGGSADINGDNVVDVQDLVAVITCWGADLSPPGPQVGINLDELNDYHGLLFNDVMKQSRAWLTTDDPVGSGPFNTGFAELMVGEDDWPAVEVPFDPDGDGPTAPQILHTLLIAELYWGPGGPFLPYDTTDADRYPIGDYAVTFQGTGAVQIYGGGTETQTYTEPGIYTVINPSNGALGLRILESSATDPIRNIKVILPGYSENEAENQYGPFYSPYVEMLKTYDVARLMPINNINNIPCSNDAFPWQIDCVMSWDARTQTTDRRQATESGVAWEYLIQLHNYAQVDPWLVIPHAADDQYVESLANMIVSDLDSNLEVHLEYSNEVWNPIYNAYHFNLANGGAINGDFPQKAYYARRSGEIFCIFRSAGLSEERMITVISGQANNPFVGDKSMEFFNDPEINPNLCEAVLDTYSIGHYFADYDQFEAEETDTIDEIVLKVHATIGQGRYYIRLCENQELANQYGVTLTAYEGGQQLIEENGTSSLQSKFAQINRSNAIKGIYLNAWNIWEKITGGTLYTYFTFASRLTAFGSWGHVEYVDQQPYVDDADGLRPYKYEAILEIKGLGP